MIDNKRMYVVAALAAGMLALAGCKKDAGAKEIELPEGQVHIGAQWAGNELWVESFDAKSSVCTLAQYKGGKVVEDSVITFKNCRVGGASPMMRPMMPNMPNRQGMQNGRPAMPGKPIMPGKPGMPMMPGKPAPDAAAPAPDAPKPAAEAAPDNKAAAQ